MHNDDYTTMEFVVYILIEVFNKSLKDANRIMMEVYEKGRGIAGIYLMILQCRRPPLLWTHGERRISFQTYRRRGVNYENTNLLMIFF